VTRPPKTAHIRAKLYKLRSWRLPDDDGVFWTCARPGRERGKNVDVPDGYTEKWAELLPGTNPAVISLLGEKSPGGDSEFKFYPFSGGLDGADEAGTTFQDLLAAATPSIALVEIPTIDLRPVPLETEQAVKDALRELIALGHHVTIIDSGGETRTGQIARYLGAQDATGTI
jgi:hypothetical protein